MDNRNKTAPEIPGRTDSGESTVRCLTAKNVVEQHFSNMTFAKAFQKIKETEAILETMQGNGIDTVEAALESMRLAGSIAAYLCKDGIYAKRAVGHRLEGHKGSGGGWGDGLNPQMICEHYGYTNVNAIQSGYHGYWPKETALLRIAELSPALSLKDNVHKELNLLR